MSTIAGRWDDYSLGVAIERHDSARYDAQARSDEIDEEIARLKAERSRLDEVACRHHNAAMRLIDVQCDLRQRAPAVDISSIRAAWRAGEPRRGSPSKPIDV